MRGKVEIKGWDISPHSLLWIPFLKRLPSSGNITLVQVLAVLQGASTHKPPVTPLHPWTFSPRTRTTALALLLVDWHTFLVAWNPSVASKESFHPSPCAVWLLLGRFLTNARSMCLFFFFLTFLYVSVRGENSEKPQTWLTSLTSVTWELCPVGTARYLRQIYS